MGINARKVLEEFLMYGIPIVVVTLMVAAIHVLAPLQAGGGSENGVLGNKPYIYYSRYKLYDNGTLELYYNTIGAQIVGVRFISAFNGDNKYNLLGEVYRGKVIVNLPSDLMKHLCISGEALKVNVSLIVRTYNTTAIFNTYPIIVRYLCRLDFNVEDRGNAIVISGSKYKWLVDEGIEVNITVNLYKTKPILRLIYTNTTRLTYYGFPITISVPSHDYGYVIVKYKLGSRIIRSGFYIEPTK